MQVLLISCSLNPDSRSAILARQALPMLTSLGAEAELIDLRGLDLPMCDAGQSYSHPDVAKIAEPLARADAVVLAVPIYNYDANAAAKNLVELTGKPAWGGKTVGFLCAAGGHGSYMSIMPLANSLMLDFRCVIVPRFVYATGHDFHGDQPSESVLHRVQEFCAELTRITAALNASPATPRPSRSL